VAVGCVDSKGGCCLKCVELKTSSLDKQDKSLDSSDRADVLTDKFFELVDSCALPPLGCLCLDGLELLLGELGDLGW